jgi:hypothetical protein
VSTPRESGIDQLISALTADGRPDELAGRDAARDAFRAAGQRAATEQTIRQRRFSPSSRPLTGWLPTRLAAIAAAAAVVIAGIAAAAYTQALPGPVQDAAHTVFAPLGVPGSQHLPAGTGPSQGPAGITTATQPATRTPSPRSVDGYVVVLTGTRVRVTGGVVAVLSGRVDQYGSPAAGVRIALVERTDGSTQWTIVATGITGPRGGFRFVTRPLTTSAVFRVATTDGAYSGPVRVAVPRASLPAGS